MKELRTPNEGKHASGGNRGIAIAAAVCFLLVLSAIYFSVKGFKEDTKANKAQISSADLSSQSESAVTVDEQTPSKSESSSISSSASMSSSSAAQSSEEETVAPAAEIEEETQDYIAPLSGEVSKTFSDDQLVFSDTLGDWRIHSGVDFLVPIGTPVEAIADGTVESVYYDELNGNTIIIDHKDGYTSVYCGLSDTAFVSEGETVTQGTVIGSVGANLPIEMGDGAHLHLEIIKDGIRIDPLSLIS